MTMFRRGRFAKARDFTGLTAQDYIRRYQAPGQGAVWVDSNTALRHSGVWAALRLRADLISTFPLDVYRDAKIQGSKVTVECPVPRVLRQPSEDMDFIDFMHASQFDLDRTGNSIGLITERDALGLPSQIELQDINKCSVVTKPDGSTWYRIGGKLIPSTSVWHERQNVVAGSAVGLSPIAYAAWTVSEFLSIQDFSMRWFNGAGVPKVEMKNVKKFLDDAQAQQAKDWYRDSVATGDVLAHGADWEYSMLQAQSSDASWIESKRFGLTDIARFFNVPADLIEAAVTSKGGTVTYQNITQLNLQFLIMNLAPTIIRREARLSKLLPQPRYVKLNTNALLRMDPDTRAAMNKTMIDSWQLTPDEAREQDNRPPLTEADYAQLERLRGPASAPKSPAPDVAPAGDNTDAQLSAQVDQLIREARATT